MDSSDAIYKGIKEAGIDFVVSVPCVNLTKIIDMIDEDEEIIHIPVTREEEGVGICAGAYMGGRKVAILMQNSGLGNSINGLKSLTELYDFPLVIIVSHRGTAGEKICGQVPMGEATTRLLEAMDYPYVTPRKPEESYNIVKNSWKETETIRKPVFILLEIIYW